MAGRYGFDLMPARLTTLMAEIKSAIAAMTTVGGYNLNWSSGLGNEPDASLLSATQETVNYHVMYGEEENGDDIGKYGMSNIEVIIEVTPKIAPSATANPLVTADSYLDSALADLRKCFLQNNTGWLPLTKEAVLTYKTATREVNKRETNYMPKKLITTWNLYYHNT
jgi:hypothetical protein